MSSQADAAQFAALVERVEALETQVAELNERMVDKDISEQVLGKPADPEARRLRREELNTAFGRRERGHPPQPAPAETATA